MNKKVLTIKNSSGFTLIELMITVAIVGILAAVALPAYQDYVARSQVSEGLTLVSGAKPVIAEYYSNHGSYPSASDIGFNGYTGSYVGTTTIGANGAIVATFSDEAHKQLRGQTVTLTPEEVDETGNLKWNCSSSVDSKFLPTSCTNDGSTGNPTNPGNGETDPTEPIWDFTNSGSYVNGLATYNGNGVLNYGGTMLNGVMVGDEMVFTLPNNQSSSMKTVTIDKDGNMSQNYDMGTYRADALYLNGGDSENIGTYSYNFDGTPFKAMMPLHQVIPDSLKTNGEMDYQKYQIWQNLSSAINQLSTIASNGVHSGTTQEAITAYQSAAQQYTNLLNEYTTSGGQLRDVEKYFLDNYNK